MRPGALLRSWGRAALLAAGVVVAAGACGPSIAPLKPRPETPRPLPAPVVPPVVQAPVAEDRPTRSVPQQMVRIALATSATVARVSASQGWSLFDRNGDRLLVHAEPNAVWTMTRRGNGVRAEHAGRTYDVDGTLVIRPDSESVLRYDERPYHGELSVLPVETGSGIMVVNRLDVELYLRGVVPLEIGPNRTLAEADAVRAQAVAARSYTYTRLNPQRAYDLTATVMDQVYGGINAERPLATSAVLETAGQVLLYEGKVINAPYHANSGGCTAAASEVWRANHVPYLIPVSDKIPGTDRFYCEESPSFRWTRNYTQASLRTVLEKYLRQYVSTAPSGSVGKIRNISEQGRTPSGRVAAVLIETDRGNFTVRGNDIRFVLRTSTGVALPSTMFSLDVTRRSGAVTAVTFRGTGNGHGVGMDQWGAIARARSGQDYRTILQTYYPGTTIGYII